MRQGIAARNAATGRPIGLEWDEGRIVSAAETEGDDRPRPGDDWVAPAFWDIQFNGRWGISFSDPGLKVEDVARVVRAQTPLGSAHVCPTLITAPFEATRHGVAAIAEACERFADVARLVECIHLEGPWISGVDGYRGAHPLTAVRDPDWDEFRRLQDAAGGRIGLVTLAPERPGALAMIGRLVGAGVVVAIGHTAADGATLAEAVVAGATLSTHLGNGIVASLPRHPNPIWHQAADDHLFASIIADGHHLDPATLKVLARAKGPGRLILVSDASPLAGLPHGAYGPWAVDPSGKIVVAGTPYLAGSNQPLTIGLGHLLQWAGLDIAEAVATVTTAPATLLGRNPPRLAPGEPADVVAFRIGEDGGVRLRGVWVDGEFLSPEAASI